VDGRVLRCDGSNQPHFCWCRSVPSPHFPPHFCAPYWPTICSIVLLPPDQFWTLINTLQIHKNTKIMHHFSPPFSAKTTKTIIQFGHHFLIQFLLFPFFLFPSQILANLVSQSVTNLPAPPSPVDAYQLELMPSLAVSMALNFQDLLKQKRVGNKAEQCPCITFAGSKKCVAYDGRYQAALTE
jgi:hypothetical protein